jgi:hypothetical protein
MEYDSQQRSDHIPDDVWVITRDYWSETLDSVEICEPTV